MSPWAGREDPGGQGSTLGTVGLLSVSAPPGAADLYIDESPWTPRDTGRCDEGRTRGRKGLGGAAGGSRGSPRLWWGAFHAEQPGLTGIWQKKSAPAETAPPPAASGRIDACFGNG